MTTRIFKIVDLDCDIIIEETTRKDILGYLDQYIENITSEYCDCSDESFEIIYDDGTTEFIDENYDGHHIRRKNILSMNYSNPCTSMTFGPFSINEYGVVSASINESIDNTNIIEIN